VLECCDNLGSRGDMERFSPERIWVLQKSFHAIGTPPPVGGSENYRVSVKRLSIGVLEG